MTDVVPEVKDSVEVEKKDEKSEVKEEITAKKAETEKNGEAAEEKTQNGTEESNKSVENGHVEENGLDKESETKDATDGSEVCGVKRKSEVGLESGDADVESSEKKQKVEESATETANVAANGDC